MDLPGTGIIISRQRTPEQPNDNTNYQRVAVFYTVLVSIIILLVFILVWSVWAKRYILRRNRETGISNSEAATEGRTQPTGLKTLILIQDIVRKGKTRGEAMNRKTQEDIGRQKWLNAEAARLASEGGGPFSDEHRVREINEAVARSEREREVERQRGSEIGAGIPRKDFAEGPFGDEHRVQQ